MTDAPRIIFWGTPEFALPALEALIRTEYRIAAVVTNPDEPVGRKQILTPPPVKVRAEKAGIPVLQPENLKDAAFAKELPEADIFIVAAYGKIIPKEILTLPRLGALNIHPSLLPHWRGPSPIQYTILSGDKKAGVTIMKIDEQMDHGPIVARQQLDNFKFQILNFKILHDTLSCLGAELLIEILPEYFGGELTPIPQDDAKATYSKILKKDDGRINWKKPAEEIERMVRAFNPWPGTWTLWPTKDKIYRIKIEETTRIENEEPRGAPGYVSQNDGILLVKTGHGSIGILRVTLESKKSLPVKAFLNGYPTVVGTNFI